MKKESSDNFRYDASLFVEEMAGNTFRYGDVHKKKIIVDVRLICNYEETRI